MGQRKSGFCYLCGLLGEIYQEERYKKYCREHMKSGDSMTKEYVDEILGHLNMLARKLYQKYPVRGEMLTGVLNRYHAVKDDEIKTELIRGEKSELENAFVGLFIKQNSVRNEIFAGLAWVIAMAAGVMEAPFYVGGEELRLLLRRSLGYLGFQGIDFVPEEFFTAVDDDMRSLWF